MATKNHTNNQQIMYSSATKSAADEFSGTFQEISLAILNVIWFYKIFFFFFFLQNTYVQSRKLEKQDTNISNLA